MNWHRYSNIEHYCPSVDGKSKEYDVVYFHSSKYWVIMCGGRGYLSSKLKIEGSFGGHEIISLPECQFATKEDAIAICERHYKLLILQ